MFIGRKNELSLLSARWQRENFECVVIYGRRRVGKTALIGRFCKDKPHIFFTGLESGTPENLQNFSQSIYEAKGNTGKAPCYSDFDAAFAAVAEMARDQRLVLAIDEYPYLAASFPGISSLLQRVIDHEFQSTKLFLILCGSSMSFMEHQVLGAKSPLFGRRTGQLHLLPLHFSEIHPFHPNYSQEELALVYGMVGGIPHYLRQIDKNLPLADNIRQNLLDPSTYLFEEPSNLLKQEVREPANYNAIVQAIATGSTKLNQIATKTGLESSACVGYLKNLMSLSIVNRETPLGEKKSRHTIYRISDPLFHFWYRFIPQHYSQLQYGMTETVYRQIEPYFSDYMGHVFEDICTEWLWEQNAIGALPFAFTETGRWWGTNKASKSQAEIDIIAQDGTKQAIFCECKWRNAPVDADVLESLQEKSGMFPHAVKFWYIFAKHGFTERCKRRAEQSGNVRLIGFGEMAAGASTLPSSPCTSNPLASS